MFYHGRPNVVSVQWLQSAVPLINGQRNGRPDGLIWLPKGRGWLIRCGRSALVPATADSAAGKTEEEHFIGFAPERWRGFVLRLSDGESTFVVVPTDKGDYELCIAAPDGSAMPNLPPFSTRDKWYRIEKLPAYFRDEWFFKRPWEGSTSGLEPDHVRILVNVACKLVDELGVNEGTMSSAWAGAICRALGLPASSQDHCWNDPIACAAAGFGSGSHGRTGYDLEAVLYEIEKRGGLIIPEPIPPRYGRLKARSAR
jgi:hypothetical protein